jgi:hypothetical protein
LIIGALKDVLPAEGNEANAAIAQLMETGTCSSVCRQSSAGSLHAATGHKPGTPQGMAVDGDNLYIQTPRRMRLIYGIWTSSQPEAVLRDRSADAR